MFSKSSYDGVTPPQKVPQIFSLKWISRTPSAFKLQNTNKVTGYNLLKKNQWLLRSSSALGALTVDYNRNNLNASLRFLLTDDGWIVWDDSTKNLKCNADVDKAIKYAPQLFELLQKAEWLEGLSQLIPLGYQVETEDFYNAYNYAPPTDVAEEKPDAPRPT